MTRSVAECAEAYARAAYVVILPDGGEARLPLGRPSPDLKALMAGQGVTTAAFMTAWNPRSEPRSLSENAAAQARLRADLKRVGAGCLDAEGRDPDGGWEAEPSLIALGLDFATACALGDAYGQNAILFAGEDATLRLVFCLLGRWE